MRVAIVALVLLLAGCVKPAPTPQPETTLAMDIPVLAAPQHGSARVVVRMSDETPLADAAVTIGNLTQLTNANGTTTFTQLSLGTHNVSATKTAHRASQASVTIQADQEAVLDIVLPLEDGANHAHASGVFAHRDLYKFSGHFDCSATYVIITGDCMTVLTNVSEQSGGPDLTNELTNESNIIPFAVDRNWTAFVAELRWNAGVETPATGQQMTIAFEPAEAPKDGHAAKYAYVEGVSPLRVQLDAGKPGPGATSGDMPNPQGGEILRARAYVAGLGHHPAGQGLLGVGAAHEHEFELFVTIFYGENAPEGYTALK